MRETSHILKFNLTSPESGELQLTLEKTLSLKKIWDINSSQATAIHTTIGEMIAVDNQPFTVVEDVGFGRLMKIVKPNYKIPCRKYFSNKVIPSIHEAIMNKVRHTVESSPFISFTTDIWTSVSNDAFISITAHCLSENFEQKVVILRVLPFEMSHTAVNITTVVQ